MNNYLTIAKNILSNGQWKGNRTGIRTLTTFCEMFRHNMNDGFPLLTTKKMGLKSIAAELEFFIKGLTNKKWLQERKCTIWNEWANPIEVEKEYKFRCSYGWMGNKKEVQPDIDDLGPIYGYQWRNFNGHYGAVNFFPEEWRNESNGVDNGSDQLKKIVETLKSNPDDRRMVCSAWNPNQIDMMALPPCHYAWTVVHINGKLNLCWKQRSCDYFLGVPYNIASYGLLLLLLCKEANLEPGELVGVLEDCHIYENHIPQIQEQISRTPYPLPKVDILCNGDFSIFNWKYTDILIHNYVSHDKISGEVAI